MCVCKRYRVGILGIADGVCVCMILLMVVPCTNGIRRGFHLNVARFLKIGTECRNRYAYVV